MLRLDNTKRKCAQECLRKYYWEHKRGLKPLRGSTALRYGTVWHSAMDAYYSHIAEFGWVKDGKALEIAMLTAQAEWQEYSSTQQNFYDDYRNLPNLLTSLIQYAGHFYLDEAMLQIIASEVLFEIEMKPETWAEIQMSQVTGFIFTGIIDLEIELNGLPWALDHKTTGKNISYVASQLRRSPQFIGYTYAAKQRLDIIPTGFMISIHHLSAYKSKKTDTYGTPKIDFDRIPEIYGEDDFTDWRLSFFETASRIANCEMNNIWPVSFDSCYNYGACPFTELCEQGRAIEDVHTDNYYQGEPWDVIAETKRRQERRQGLLTKVKS